MNTEPVEHPHVGLVCRACGCRHFRALYTRRHARAMVRVRECRLCGKRIKTIERERGDGA